MKARSQSLSMCFSHLLVLPLLGYMLIFTIVGFSCCFRSHGCSLKGERENVKGPKTWVRRSSSTQSCPGSSPQWTSSDASLAEIQSLEHACCKALDSLAPRPVERGRIDLNSKTYVRREERGREKR